MGQLKMTKGYKLTKIMYKKRGFPGRTAMFESKFLF